MFCVAVTGQGSVVGLESLVALCHVLFPSLLLLYKQFVFFLNCLAVCYTDNVLFIANKLKIFFVQVPKVIKVFQIVYHTNTTP